MQKQYVGHSVIQVSFQAHFMLDGHWYRRLGNYFNWQGRNKQETRKKSLFGNISLTRLYRMVTMSK